MCKTKPFRNYSYTIDWDFKINSEMLQHMRICSGVQSNVNQNQPISSALSRVQKLGSSQYKQVLK